MKRTRICSCLSSGNCPRCDGEPYRYELDDRDEDIMAAIREEHPDWDEDDVFSEFLKFNWQVLSI